MSATAAHSQPLMSPAVRAGGGWMLASWASALVVLVSMLFSGGYRGYEGPGSAIVSLALPVALGVGAAFVLLGLVALVLAARAALSTVGLARLIGAFAVFAGVLAVAAVFAVFPFLVFGMALPLGGAAAVGLVYAAGRMPDGVRPGAPPAQRVLLGMAFAVATLGVVAAGLLHILVWNPLARVPGLSLDEIYVAMAAANESPGIVLIVGWAAFWGLAALALPVVCAVWPHRSTAFLTVRRVVVLGLLLVAATAYSAWWAGFGMGMSLADTFMTSGGDAAASGALISIVGQVSVIVALFLALAPRGALLSLMRRS